MTYIPDLKESAGTNLQILQMFGMLTKSFDMFKKKNKYDVGPADKTKWFSYKPLFNQFCYEDCSLGIVRVSSFCRD